MTGLGTLVNMAAILIGSGIGLPVFRRSTMKVPTFSNSLVHLKSLIYLINLDFTGKFNVLTGHFFIEKIFDMSYNNSTT